MNISSGVHAPDLYKSTPDKVNIHHFAESKDVFRDKCKDFHTGVHAQDCKREINLNISCNIDAHDCLAQVCKHSPTGVHSQAHKTHIFKNNIPTGVYTQDYLTHRCEQTTPGLSLELLVSHVDEHKQAKQKQQHQESAAVLAGHEEKLELKHSRKAAIAVASGDEKQVNLSNSSSTNNIIKKNRQNKKLELVRSGLHEKTTTVVVASEGEFTSSLSLVRRKNKKCCSSSCYFDLERDLDFTWNQYSGELSPPPVLSLQSGVKSSSSSSVSLALNHNPSALNGLGLKQPLVDINRVVIGDFGDSNKNKLVSRQQEEDSNISNSDSNQVITTTTKSWAPDCDSNRLYIWRHLESIKARIHYMQVESERVKGQIDVSNTYYLGSKRL